MGSRKLWYVQNEEGEITGPFPEKSVRQQMIIGRFDAQHLISRDRESWMPISILSWEDDPTEWEDDSWAQERARAAVRWADERTGEDRRSGVRPTPGRRAGDRYGVHGDGHVAHWRLGRLFRGPMGGRTRKPLLFGIFALAATGLLLYWATPLQPMAIDLSRSRADCGSDPSPQVHWGGCEKTSARLARANLEGAQLVGVRMSHAQLDSANLRYADLSGANLSGASLVNADLTGAQLTGANVSYGQFHGADLRYANLKGADLAEASFAGARLGNAIWADGSECAPDSVGLCVVAGREQYP